MRERWEGKKESKEEEGHRRTETGGGGEGTEGGRERGRGKTTATGVVFVNY